jgi:ribose transport system permease protein
MTVVETKTDAATTTRAASFDVILWLARYGTVTFLVLLLIVFSASRPEVFPTIRNLLNILNQISILGIIAAGLTVCLVMGLFDLSIAALATFGGYASAYILIHTTDPGVTAVVLTVAGVLAIAALVGILNGFLVSYLGISAFIETLAMGSVITGIILGVSQSRTIMSGIPDTFLAIGQSRIYGVPSPVLIMLAVAVVLWIFLEQTQAGRNMYAIGGNREAARLSGIAVKRYALIALGVCAACAALGGMVAGANLGAGRPQGVGEAYLLNAFASVFIGASTLRPGRFHILGTVIGVLLIGVINNGLSILGVETFWQYIVQGALLILALFSAGLLTSTRR